MSSVLAGITFTGFRVPVETLVDRTLGTNIGNLTNSGGLAGAFDGVTNQASTGCAVGNTGTTGLGYVGKQHSSGKIPSKIVVYGSNNNGYANGINSMVLEFRVSNSAPSAATDGSSVGSISFTEVSDESTGRTITSSDTTNTYTYWWLRGINNDGTDSFRVAEVQMYEMA